MVETTMQPVFIFSPGYTHLACALKVSTTRRETHVAYEPLWTSSNDPQFQPLFRSQAIPIQRKLSDFVRVCSSALEGTHATDEPQVIFHGQPVASKTTHGRSSAWKQPLAQFWVGIFLPSRGFTHYLPAIQPLTSLHAQCRWVPLGVLLGFAKRPSKTVPTPIATVADGAFIHGTFQYEASLLRALGVAVGISLPQIPPPQPQNSNIVPFKTCRLKSTSCLTRQFYHAFMDLRMVLMRPSVPSQDHAIDDLYHLLRRLLTRLSTRSEFATFTQHQRPPKRNRSQQGVASSACPCETLSVYLKKHGMQRFFTLLLHDLIVEQPLGTAYPRTTGRIESVAVLMQAFQSLSEHSLFHSFMQPQKQHTRSLQVPWLLQEAIRMNDKDFLECLLLHFPLRSRSKRQKYLWLPLNQQCERLPPATRQNKHSLQALIAMVCRYVPAKYPKDLESLHPFLVSTVMDNMVDHRKTSPKPSQATATPTTTITTSRIPFAKGPSLQQHEGTSLAPHVTFRFGKSPSCKA